VSTDPSQRRRTCGGPRSQGRVGAAIAPTGTGILFNEHIAEDGPIVFAHACRLGAEGIVSKKVDGTYRFGPCRVWIKVRNPASIAVQREEERNLEPMNTGSARRR
jgi:bifunctional non-homologous end joining protein LigD